MPFRKLQDILFFLPCLFLSWIAVNQGFSSFTLMINIYLPFIWESHTFCTGVAKFRVIIRLRRQYRPGTPEFCYSVPGPPDVLPLSLAFLFCVEALSGYFLLLEMTPMLYVSWIRSELKPENIFALMFLLSPFTALLLWDQVDEFLSFKKSERLPSRFFGI